MFTALKPSKSHTRAGLIVASLTMLSACVTVPQQYSSSRLALEKGTFSGFKYTYDGSEPEGVYNFWGTYSGSFTDRLSEQPSALEEARRALPYQYASLGLTAAFTIYAVSELVKGSDTGSGSFSDINEAEGHLTNVIGAALGIVITGIVLGIPARNHLYNSVGMFNGGLAQPSDRVHRGMAPKLLPILPSTVRLNASTRQVDIGWRLRLDPRR